MRPLLLVTESLPEDFHTDNIRARYSDLVAEFAESKETVRGCLACVRVRVAVADAACAHTRVRDTPGHG